MPDIFIPVQRTAGLKFYNVSVNKGILFQFVFYYTDRNRQALKSYKDAADFDKRFKTTTAIYGEYVAYAEKNGLKYTPAETASSMTAINSLLKSYIARNLYDEKGFYPIFLKTDPAFVKAVETLSGK